MERALDGSWSRWELGPDALVRAAVAGTGRQIALEHGGVWNLGWRQALRRIARDRPR